MAVGHALVKHDQEAFSSRAVVVMTPHARDHAGGGRDGLVAAKPASEPLPAAGA